MLRQDDDDDDGGHFPVNDAFHCVIFNIVSSAELNTAFSHTPVTEPSFSNRLSVSGVLPAETGRQPVRRALQSICNPTLSIGGPEDTTQQQCYCGDFFLLFCTEPFVW